MMMLAMAMMMRTTIVRCNRDGAAPLIQRSFFLPHACTDLSKFQCFTTFQNFNACAVGSFLPFLLFNISFLELPFCTLLPL